MTLARLLTMSDRESMFNMVTDNLQQFIKLLAIFPLVQFPDVTGDPAAYYSVNPGL